MYETVDVPLADLQLDTANARLGKEQPSQQATYLALAEQQGRRLVRLAAHIVDHGLDPSTFPVVVATGDRRVKYRVLEGNRRVLALKVLETPSIVSPTLNSADQKRLNELAKRYATDPVETVSCILFDDEQEALRWVEIRHTGANEGIGLTEWDANEKDRFRARHSSQRGRQPAGQVIDFINRLEGSAAGDNKGILTNISRLVSTPAVRDALGLEKSQGTIVSRYPAKEVAKGLLKIVEDMRSGRLKVGRIYYEEDRVKYIEGFTKGELPDPAKALKSPVSLDDLPLTGQAKKGGQQTPNTGTRRKKATPPRGTVVPTNCRAKVTHPRINSIYNELLMINVEQFPNACAVMLRVFVELSVDHEIDKSSLMTEKQRRETPLSRRLKTVAGHLEQTGAIPNQLKLAIAKIADSQDVIAASSVTWNQYVHNQYVYPRPSELRTAWDELQPFIEKLWPAKAGR